MTKSSTMAPPRKILKGESDPRREGGFLLTLDDGVVVETADLSIAQAAKRSIDLGRFVELDLEATDGGRQRIVELRILAANASADAERPTTSPAPKSTAIAKAPAIPQHLIVRPDELAHQMQAMGQHYNVLSPAIAVSNMAPGYGANLAVVQIDPAVTFDEQGNGAGPDCYFSASLFKDKSKRALNKQGLLKIAQAAGIQWMPGECRRTDDGKERFFWAWRYFGHVRTHDGQLMPVSGSRELDLRDGAAEAAPMKPAQLMKARAMGNQICETKAMQRAIRTLGIRQTYTVDELRKPFLIVRFSFTPDMDDPEIKKLVTQQAMSGIGALYAPPAAPALPPPGDDIEQAMPTVTSETPKPASNPFAEPASQTASSDGAAPAQATADALPPGATTIVDVKYTTGRNAKSGRTWRLATVTFATGQVAATFSEAMQQLIDEAATHKAPVRIETAENENYDDKLVSLTVVDRRQPSLPIGDDANGKY